MHETDIIKKLDALQRTTKSNNTVDVLGEELAIATILKRYANKRYDHAVEDIIAEYPNIIAETKTKAITNNIKSEHVWRGKEVVIQVSCNTPVERPDATQFYNELIKLGVKKSVVDEAFAKCKKKNAPATSFTAVRVE